MKLRQKAFTLLEVVIVITIISVITIIAIPVWRGHNFISISEVDKLVNDIKYMQQMTINDNHQYNMIVNDGGRSYHIEKDGATPIIILTHSFGSSITSMSTIGGWGSPIPGILFNPPAGTMGAVFGTPPYTITLTTIGGDTITVSIDWQGDITVA